MLKYKGVSVRVAFVDGNTYNGTPAKCYTNNPFKQKAIEASQMFKDKEIVLERVVEEASDRKKTEKPATVQKRAGVRTAAAVKTSKAVNRTAGKPAGAGAAGAETADDGEKKMSFDNLAEAIQYIATNYQEQVMTANEARTFLKERGIKATIKNG